MEITPHEIFTKIKALVDRMKSAPKKYEAIMLEVKVNGNAVGLAGREVSPGVTVI